MTSALRTVWNVTPGKVEKDGGIVALRMRRLRSELIRELGKDEWTQETVAKRGSLTRVEVNKVEKGLNKATTDRIRRGLAAGYQASYADMCAYLDGEIEVADLLRRRQAPAPKVDRFTAPQDLWETFRNGKVGRGRHKWSLEALEAVARDYPNGPPEGGWAKALTRAESAVKHAPPKADRPAPEKPAEAAHTKKRRAG